MSPIAAPEGRLPVCVVTGFLGAGKTTLLKRVLRDPRFADSAVIVNEFGEVPLDHDLIAASEDMLISVSTGCLCCVVRSDLTETLLDLARRRAAAEVPAYARVVIETSGLADPAPILHALMADERVAAGHRLQSVATLVDAATGAAVLERHPEAQRQVMLADRLLLTKTDLAPVPATLETALAALNPAAPRRVAAHGEVDPEWLFAPGSLPAFLEANARHTEGVASIVLEREAPIPALALTLWLQGLVEHCGPRLLRLKGLVALAEAPEKPVALHAVQHLLHPLEWLDAWPGTDRHSRIVLIGEGIPRHLPARLLAAIEAEVRDS
ncbi:GTP-binding protein [Siccirubricoccus sp. KC 17139]|uniref:GTP-binding protein n=1 Tax=Siccirubricoccus soli TaxID=2899147 RepID=A0ABT1CY71_9PROT|nr:GTP-binding protein [Siccirubricoccus soli]MCO6414611.1 GTP-binding protein [Siccirubricoccus soli]MCP2680741.1 GTP-binding protein [Siccirubricoccus soli]